MKTKFKFLLFGFFFFLINTSLELKAQDDSSSPRLEHGSYFGYLKSHSQNEKFAIQAEFYLESPEDFTQFPHLNALIKINLGGFNSSEYVTHLYKNIQYDFDNNILTFDEPNNDLAISAKIKNENGRTKIIADVFIRSAAQTANLILESASDEPDFFNSFSSLPQSKLKVKKKEYSFFNSENFNFDQYPLAPKIDGQYVGQCKNQKALFQIQTMRGLNDQNSRDGRILFDYEIIGRLGYFKKSSNANEPSHWETYASFSGGNYNLFTGSLLFLGPSSNAIDCKLEGGKLTCNFRSRDEILPCQFTLENRKDLPKIIFPRLHHISPSKDQLKELPSPNPPTNTELTKALGGHFVGYLHHESSDKYQSMALHVIPSSLTDNPHNPNKMYISTTAILYYGRTTKEHFITQRYEPRSFYLRPGYTLGAPGTDSFILIQDWRQGYIRGVWYSQNYGKVGTIELIKSEELPPLSLQAKIIPSWEGEFEGPYQSSKDTGFRWFRILFPNQPSERLESTVNFTGAYLSNKNVSSLIPMERGRFDPYTGSIGWIFNVNNGVGMISGQLAEEDQGLLLYWPPYPNVFATTMGDYKLEIYNSIKKGDKK